MLRRTALLLLCVAGCTFQASKVTCNAEFTPETILTGGLYQIGDYTDCVSRRQEQYCLAQVQLKAANVSSLLWKNIEELGKLRTHFRRDLLHVGICVPVQSIVTDVRTVLEDSLRDAAKTLGVSAEVTIDERSCRTNEQQHPITALDLLTGFGVVVVTLLVLCATGYDAFTNLQKHKLPAETKRTSLLLCFSLITNSKKLYAISRTTARGDLWIIQATRCITVCLTVLLHTILIVLLGPISNPELVEESFVNIFWTSIYSFTVCMGVFFCMGGFLFSYTFLDAFDGKKVFKWSDFLMVIFYRYIRLTPVYAVVIVFGASWLIHMGDSPMWNIVAGAEVDNCRRHWWINLLYFNNYIEPEEMCLLQTWYLAADFQCRIVAMLLLVLVWKHSRCAKVVFTGVLLTTIVICFVHTYVEGLDPLVLIFPGANENLMKNDTFSRAYVTFQYNFGAYFVGVIFGYVYYNIKRTGVKCLKMGHWMVLLSAFTTLVSINLVSTVFYSPSYQHDALTASLFACSHRIIVAAATGTIVMACALGNGGIFNRIASSWLLHLLGHLSYCVYLIHLYVIVGQITVTKKPIVLSGFFIARSAVSAILVSYALAAVLHLLVEMPSAALFKWILTDGGLSQRDTGRRREHSD